MSGQYAVVIRFGGPEPDHPVMGTLRALVQRANAEGDFRYAHTHLQELLDVLLMNQFPVPPTPHGQPDWLPVDEATVQLQRTTIEVTSDFEEKKKPSKREKKYRL